MVDGVTLSYSRMGVAGSKLEKALGDHFPEGERYFGLENYGNTCYCNSVLQVMISFFCFDSFDFDSLFLSLFRAGEQFYGLMVFVELPKRDLFASFTCCGQFNLMLFEGNE